MGSCTIVVLAPHCKGGGVREAVQKTVSTLLPVHSGVKPHVVLVVDDRGGKDLVWILDNLMGQGVDELYVSPEGPTGWGIAVARLIDIFAASTSVPAEDEKPAIYGLVPAGLEIKTENWLEKALYDLESAEGEWVVECGGRIPREKVVEEFMNLGESKYLVPQLTGGCVLLPAPLLLGWRPNPYLPLYPDSVGSGIWADLTDEIHAKGMEILSDVDIIFETTTPKVFLTDTHVGFGGFPQVLTVKGGNDAGNAQSDAAGQSGD